MQTAAPLAYVPQTGPARAPEAAQRAEFRFASDAALERALALAASQSWIASCTVDRSRRTLSVVLSAGSVRALPASQPTLH
jgi:hypothetical protein